MFTLHTTSDDTGRHRPVSLCRPVSRVLRSVNTALDRTLVQRKAQRKAKSKVKVTHCIAFCLKGDNESNMSKKIK